MRFLFFCALCAGLLAGSPVVAQPAHDVEIGLFVIDITDLDERASTFTAEIDVVSRWHDPARAFVPEPGAPAQRIFIEDAGLAELGKGWQPALHAVNAIGSYERVMFRTTVQADGTMTNRVRLRMTLRAPLDFRYFPFDTQVLPIRVESMIWPDGALTLAEAADFSGFAEDFEMPEWAVTGMVARPEVIERRREGRAYERVTFEIEIVRHQGFYIWKIIMPMMIIVILSWIVFWMSSEMLGRRAGVSSTGMLTVIAYQFIVAGSLPRFPYLTVMDRVALLALVSIAATMVVNLLGSRLEEPARLRLDRVCRVVFPVAITVTLVAILVLRMG